MTAISDLLDLKTDVGQGRGQHLSLEVQQIIYRYVAQISVKITGCVHSFAVGRQKLFLVKLTTIGMSLVPMFFCQWYIFLQTI